MKLKDFDKWRATLPPEFDEVEIKGFIASESYPVTVKRVIAYTCTTTGEKGMCLNPMGTHIPESMWAALEDVHILTGRE